MPGLIIRPWEAEAEAMWDDEVQPADIARHFGVSKGVIAGLANRRGWAAIRSRAGRDDYEYKGTTLFTRLAAINAKMDALLPPRRS